MEDGRTYIFLDTIEEVAAFLTVLSAKGASVTCDKRDGVWRLEVFKEDHIAKVTDQTELNKIAFRIYSIGVTVNAELNKVGEVGLGNLLSTELSQAVNDLLRVVNNANKKED